MAKQKNGKESLEAFVQKEEKEAPKPEFDYSEEEADGLYGWKFHKGPLIAAVVLTVVFYLLVFLWVD